MEKQKKDQFVIVNLADLNNVDLAIDHAVDLAQRLNKGVILLHVEDERYKATCSADAESRLQECKRSIEARQGNITVSYMTLKGNTKVVIESLPTLLNGVVAVTTCDPDANRKSPMHPKNVLSDFSDSKIAYLVVRANQAFKPFLNVALSIDFHRESKEKLIWSSYFARFGGSGLHVLYHDYKDEGLRQKWYNNMLFLHKFYSKLGLTFMPHVVPGNASSVDADALKFIEQTAIDMLVAVTTKEKDIFDSLLGTQEQRTIRNPQGLPILFLNPRDDIYVLCD